MSGRQVGFELFQLGASAIFPINYARGGVTLEVPSTINYHVVKSTAVGALGGLLFGFDTAVISGTTHALSQTFHLTPATLGVTVSSALVGTVIGAMASGIPGQKFGRRDSLRVMALFYFVSAIGCAFAWNWWSLLSFRFIGGLGIGGSSVLGPMYIAEIAPPKWRGRLVGFFQINIVVGILVAYTSNAMIRSIHLGPADWRWMLGISGLPALLFFLILFSIPRSPRWLVTQSRFDEAVAVIRLIGVPQAQEELNAIIESIRIEQSAGDQSLLSRQHRRPMFLAITVGVFSQLAGINAILYYLNDIFAYAGASQVSNDLQTIAVGATNLVSTCIAMSMIDKIGRRKLLIGGTIGLASCLMAISILFGTHSHLNWLAWIVLLYIALYAVSQGAVVWVYMSEVLPNCIRSKGVSVGSSSLWITNAAISLVFPIMAKSSGAYPFSFFAIMMTLDVFIVLFLYPETRGVSLETLQNRIVFTTD